jgi:hypothetical protein
MRRRTLTSPTLSRSVNYWRHPCLGLRRVLDIFAVVAGAAASLCNTIAALLRPKRLVCLYLSPAN